MTISSSDHASTTELVPVYRVLPEQSEGQGALIVLHSGAFRMILEVGSVAFDMKAEEEQEALIYSYGNLLSSLPPDFPIQIWCHTKRLNPERYLQQFDERLANPATPDLMRRLIEDHRQHFAGQVMSQNLLERRFYITVPFKGTPGPAQDKFADQIPFAGLFRVISAKVEGPRAPQLDARDVDIARQQLDLRAHHVAEQVGRMGISARRLDEVDVVRLLNEVCHPGLSEHRPVTALPSQAGLIGSMTVASDDSGRRRAALQAPGALQEDWS